MRNYLAGISLKRPFTNPRTVYVLRAVQKAPPETRQQINALLALTQASCDTLRQRALYLQLLLPAQLPTSYARLNLTPALLDFAELAEVLVPHPLPIYPPAEVDLPDEKTLRLAAASAWLRPPRKAKEAACFSDLENAFYGWGKDTMPTCPNCNSRTHWAALIGTRRHRNVLLNKCPNAACNMAFLSCE